MKNLTNRTFIPLKRYLQVLKIILILQQKK